MIKNERQRAFMERRKERGEKNINFYAQPSLINALNNFAEKVRRPRTHVIKGILMGYLKKQGYEFDELWTIMDKPKKDVL